MSLGQIRISEVRELGRAAPELAVATLDLIAGAEALEREHRLECGCARPGTGSCVWDAPAGALLAAFDFDEETEQR